MSTPRVARNGTGEPLYDVLTEAGEVLALDIAFDAAHDLARKHRDASEFPACGEAVIRSVRTRDQREQPAASRYVLPEPPEVGPPPLQYCGSELGLEDAGSVIIHANTSAGLVGMTLEQALRNIDQFAEPGRSRILFVLHYHFDMPGGVV